MTVARGRTNAEIADDLCISLSTVKSHLASLMSKLERSQPGRARHVGLRDRPHDLIHAPSTDTWGRARAPLARILALHPVHMPWNLGFWTTPPARSGTTIWDTRSGRHRPALPGACPL
ncbi:MAG: helix-turn-helix transcriptional regulator [Acidimicrobiales bacterium]|nr:helix-turn-helix transcriptional regulator [Acidimicrobiales bacterium]